MRSLACLLLAAVAVGCAPVAEDDVVDLAPMDWDTPLGADVLGVDPGPEYQGSTLAQIVSGQVDGRGPGRSCTACHFTDTVTLYQPEVDQYAMEPIGPYDIVDGRTWAGNNGWAAIFTQMVEGTFTEKPEKLRLAMDRFLEEEAQRVEPLDWNATIRPENMGVYPEPYIDGDTLDGIINSDVSARPDNLLCSGCHYADANIAYRPPVERNQTGTTFGPNDIIDGRAWAGPDGWAAVFVELGPNADTHKPDYLRSMFFKWKDDGAY